MKKGDRYVGKVSGLCLEVKDTAKGSCTVEAERRVTDKKTGEIVIEKRIRVIENNNLKTALMGYKKA